MDGIWILNGPGHRLHELGQLVVAIAEHELTAPGGPAPMIDTAGEEFVCDRCNGTIPVFHPEGLPADKVGPDPTRLPPAGRLRPIPVADGMFLCPDCFPRVVVDPDVTRTWPGCACPPCQDARN